MKRFIDYISRSLDLSHEQEEVIYYGLFVVITNLISILSVLLIGYMMNQLKETCLLMISYLPLRLYLGGYHCQSAQRCFVVFNIFFILIIFMMNMKNSYFLNGLTEILLLVILFDKKREHQQVTNFAIIGYNLLILLLSVFFYKYTYIVVLAVDFNIFLYFLNQIKNIISLKRV